jgi:hypothetical protein
MRKKYRVDAAVEVVGYLVSRIMGLVQKQHTLLWAIHLLFELPAFLHTIGEVSLKVI